jgi:hypothetical protein
MVRAWIQSIGGAIRLIADELDSAVSAPDEAEPEAPPPAEPEPGAPSCIICGRTDAETQLYSAGLGNICAACTRLACGAVGIPLTDGVIGAEHILQRRRGPPKGLIWNDERTVRAWLQSVSASLRTTAEVVDFYTPTPDGAEPAAPPPAPPEPGAWSCSFCGRTDAETRLCLGGLGKICASCARAACGVFGIALASDEAGGSGCGGPA